MNRIVELKEPKMKTVEIVEIKKPVCPAYASPRTRERFAAWAEWNGYGRRPAYPEARLIKERENKRDVEIKTVEHPGWIEHTYA